jgi:hypothetical protein
VDAVIIETQKGEAGLILVLKVQSPKEYRGIGLAHSVVFYDKDKVSFSEAALEMARMGLSAQQMMKGNVPELLKGRSLKHHYRSDPQMPTGYTIEILDNTGSIQEALNGTAN